MFFTARNLRHYFHDHTVTVVSKAPLKDIINNSDATGRVAKWGIELALADFVPDWIEAMESTTLLESEYWIIDVYYMLLFL